MTPPLTEAQRKVRAQQRAALWNATYRSLYGPPEGEYIELLPPDDPRSADVPIDLTRAQVVGRPGALRRILAPLMLKQDFLARMVDADVRELVVASQRDRRSAPETFEEALAELQRYAREILGRTPQDNVDRELHALKRLRADEELLVIEPAIVSQRQGVATVSRRARFRMPFADLKRLLNPDNWLEMGPFFERVGAVEAETNRREEEADGWNGIFEEIFVVDWSRFRLQTFHTFLKIDYTYDADRVRTDYSLVYEEDDQLEQDCGYLEVRRIPGRLGWCEYYGEKSMRCRSPQSNMFAPMLTAVFLESGLSAMEEAAIRHNVVDGDGKVA